LKPERNLQIALKLLNQIKYATIATTDSDQPWNTPVFTAYDHELNFYWSSFGGAQHSQNIALNNKVFLVIYNSASPEGIGLYISATASKLVSKTEISKGLEVLGERRKKKFDLNSFQNGSQTLYKATPVSMWLNDWLKNDEGEFVKDYRFELSIQELKRQI